MKNYNNNLKTIFMIVHLESLPSVLDFESDRTWKGIFSIKSMNEAYFFEWIPGESENTEEIFSNGVKTCVFFFFHNIKSIKIEETAEKCLILKFFVPDFTTYSRFIVSPEYNSKTTEFFNSLIDIGLLQLNQKQKNVFDCLFSVTRNYKATPGSVSLFSLQAYHAHMRACNRIYTENIKIDLEVGSSMIAEFVKGENCIPNYKEMKKVIYIKGCDESYRPLLWLYLFGVYSPNYDKGNNERKMNKLIKQYLVLKHQWNSIIEEQQESIRSIKELVNNDVKRTDRESDHFRTEDSIGMQSLKNIMFAYILFHRNTSYVQGMCDLATPFFHLFIKLFLNENEVLMWNDEVYTREKAETIVFWCFNNMMDMSSYVDIFGNLKNSQTFLSERILSIASSVHPMLGQWLQIQKIDDLLFIYKSCLLQFKRDFPIPALLRIWDTIYSSEKPKVFIRFLSGAILFSLFPLLITKPCSNLGEVMKSTSESFNELNIEEVLKLSHILMEKGKTGPQSRWILMDYPKEKADGLFNSEYLENSKILFSTK